MGLWNDIVTTGTGGVYSPDNGFSLPGVGMYTNTSYGKASGIGGKFEDMIPGIGDAKAQAEANRQNVKLWGMTNAWNEHMSSTAYQRAMADMRKAGLNPMLAYQQGGASTPTAQAPTVQAASKTGLANFGLNAITGISAVQSQAQNSASQAAQVNSSVNLQAAQTAKEVATTQQIKAETALKQRELRGKGVKDTLDREGGSIIQKIFDTLKSSAKDPVIKPAPASTPAQRKALEEQNNYIQKWKKQQGHR